MSLHDRHRIEERLRTVADPVGFLTNLFTHAPVGFAVWSADGHTLLTNKAFMELFGSEPPPEYNVLKDDILAANGMLALFERAFAGETVEVPTFWFDPRDLKTVTVADGRRVAISMTIFPLFKPDGSIDYVAATYKDETEIMVAAERLAHGDERFRLAQQAARLGTFEWNVRTGVNSWSAELERMYGLELGEFGSSQASWEDLLHPDDRAHAVALVERAFGTSTPVEGEWRVRWRDGTVRWILGRFQVFVDGDGRPLRLIGVNLDITERKQEDTGRRLAEGRRAAVTRAALDAIVVMDHAGAVVDFNPAAERLFGYARGDVVGRKLSHVLVPPALRDSHERGLARYLETSEPRVIGTRVELSALHRSGREFPVEIAVVPIEGEDPPMFIGFIRDLTQQKQAELLRAKGAELEAENQRIQIANRAKSEFLAAMSHELRTPLNAVIGFAELLHDGATGPVSEQQREFLSDILVGGRHLLHLINDILDLSKVEAGKLELHPEQIDVAALIDEIVSILRPTTAAKRARIDVAIAPDLGDVTLDPSRLRQILYNLVSNAIKFGGDDGVVTIRATPEGTHALRIGVADRGIGIRPDDLDRLFLPFEQLRGQRQPGTGLGLALTRRLVEAQGGTITVSSESGVGSEFHVVLPRRTHGRTIPLPWSTSAIGPHARVLLIDDAADEQTAIARSLVDSGYNVEVAATGTQAVAMCRRAEYAAIVLAFVLPDTTGLDVLRTIRSVGVNRGTPVVMIGDVTQDGVKGFAIHDILTKPVDTAALVAALHRARVRASDVLVVDDDPASHRLVAAALDVLGYRVEGCMDGATALAKIAVRRPSAIILDLVMPGLDGLGFLAELQRDPEHRAIPVIVWTVKDLAGDELDELRRHVRAIVQKGAGISDLVAALDAQLAGKP